jgi:hypothetical protein
MSWWKIFNLPYFKERPGIFRKNSAFLKLNSTQSKTHNSTIKFNPNNFSALDNREDQALDRLLHGDLLQSGASGAYLGGSSSHRILGIRGQYYPDISLWAGNVGSENSCEFLGFIRGKLEMSILVVSAERELNCPIC